MSKDIMTLSDLYAFFAEKNKSLTFDLKEAGKDLLVSEKGALSFEKKTKNGLLPVHLKSCHTGIDINGYRIDDDVMKKAIPSFTNRPILAFIYEDEDGKLQFHRHDHHKDPAHGTIFDEAPVGIIPETNNARLAFDEKNQKTYLEIDGFLYDDYSKAGEILRREGECACSVELDVKSLAFDAREKVLDILDFEFKGVTILGVTTDGTPIEPGMEGSKVTLLDFDKMTKENTQSLSQKIDELGTRFDALLTGLSSFDAKKGGKPQQMTRLEELLKEYGKEKEDLPFSPDGLSDEVLAKKFEEAFPKDDEHEGKADDPEPQDEKADAPAPKADDTAPEETKPGLTFAFQGKDGHVKTFAVSLDEKRQALSDLINHAYSDDSHCYSISDVFEGEGGSDNYLVMTDFQTNEAYKQGYEKTKDGFALTGNRTKVSPMWVTADEKASIDTMRNMYPEMEKKLKAFEEEPEKLKVLDSADYAGIRDTKEFSALMEKNAHFDLSIDEVRKKADALLLTAAKSGTIRFEKSEDRGLTPSRKAILPTGHKGTGKYGMLFAD